MRIARRKVLWQRPALLRMNAQFDAAVVAAAISRQGIAAAFHRLVLTVERQRIGAAITLGGQDGGMNPGPNESFADGI